MSLFRLKRHPLPIKAFFRHSLVLTYALPQEALLPLLPPGLSLDTHRGLGFLAIALVQTEALRPCFLPAFCGKSFFLSGYRIFARLKTRSGRTLRGLKILRSDTDRRGMVFFGNLLTHYHYRHAEVRCVERDFQLEIGIRTPRREADLRVVADLKSMPAPLPAGSPFADLKEARKFAGPLPFTFDYEAETHSVIRIEGVRQSWNPQPVRVSVLENSFLEKSPFCEARPVLANAFYVKNVPYLWKKGVREVVPSES